MTPDQYLASLLSKYTVNVAAAKAAGNAIYPLLQQWGNDYLLSADFSGSLAKGTGISISSDADIFLSISSSTPGTLAQIYNSLLSYVSAAGYSARMQNVSVRVSVNGNLIDLVPGRRHSQWGDDHSLYRSKAQSWIQTNIAKHISYVSGSGRIDEIRILKLWRSQHQLEFPSFFLEMATIDALRYSQKGNLAANVWKVLEHLRDNIQTVRYIDPANTNNVISDDCTIFEKAAIATKAASSLKEQNWGQIVW